MSAPSDLLAQARGLARKETRRPKQTSLRRAISTAYYSLFHFLGEESAKRFVGTSLADKRFRDLARRAIAHSKLKLVAEKFAKPTPKAAVLKPFWSPVPGNDPLRIIGDADFATIATTFSALQQLRHDADSDFSTSFTRRQALDACDKAEDAMAAWRKLKSDKPDALKLFAIALLLWPGLSGRR